MKRTCFTADIVPRSKNSFVSIAVQNGSEWFRMDIPVEQHAVIRFYVRLGKSPGEIGMGKN